MSDTKTAEQAPIEQTPQPIPEVVQKQYDHLVETIRAYNPGADFAQIDAAFHYAAAHHGTQKRKDGSPFVTHPIAVAQIVAEELHLDSESIIAALLHDCIEDTDATYDDIAKRFSPTVADLVEGVSKLTRVHYTSKEEEQMENLRKMLMAMAKDIRVILIKIADRTHNMRTMEYQSTDKQRQKSLETMEIYAPIAHRLGMQRMKWELEDLSLKYLDPTAFNEITHSLEEKSKEYGSFMERIQKQIEGKLTEDHIPFRRVYGRMKHPYSIYRKMYAQSKTMDEVFDLFAFRVIVDTVADCYNVLGVIHDLYRPVLGRFKDYIGTPKPNGYQSLHTTVMGPDGVMFEVQIRTQEMHDIAEYGIAAHWKYKQRISGSANEQNYEWVRRLLENQENTDAEEFIHTLKVDMFADEVFVFTPRGDVTNLPTGATPIDFAYSVHSAVGNSMVGAKVNGRIVPLDYQLKNGDVVEILTSKSARGPSRDWLQIAKSNEARGKIRQWFKKEKREEPPLNPSSSTTASPSPPSPGTSCAPRCSKRPASATSTICMPPSATAASRRRRPSTASATSSRLSISSSRPSATPPCPSPASRARPAPPFPCVKRARTASWCRGFPTASSSSPSAARPFRAMTLSASSPAATACPSTAPTVPTPRPSAAVPRRPAAGSRSAGARTSSSPTRPRSTSTPRTASTSCSTSPPSSRPRRPASRASTPRPPRTASPSSISRSSSPTASSSPPSCAASIRSAA